MTSITMPKLSDTMTEGIFGSWKKSVGERIARGDVVAEVETDKATMELEAFADGILLEQRAQPGETVAVGAVIGLIGEPGEKPSAGGPPPEQPAGPGSPEKPAGGNEQHPAPDREPQPPVETERSAEFRLPEPGPEVDLRAETGKIRPPGEAAAPPLTPPSTPPTGDVKSAPIVRRRAQELGIDLDKVQGSGPGGRILLADLERQPAPRIHEPGDEQRRPEREASQPTPPGVTAEEPLSRMRTAIARTVVESWRTIPHFTVTGEILMERAEQVRGELRQQGLRISVTDMFVKGAALALERFPRLNSSLSGEKIVFHPEINIGIMARVPDGLLVPVIRGCGKRSLPDISRTVRALLERARSGRPSENDLREGTFSISNLGMYGVSRFTAIILPPQVAVLALGAVRELPKPSDAGGRTEKRIEVTLSADHRVLDGVEAAEFIGELKRVMEHPVLLLLDQGAVKD